METMAIIGQNQHYLGNSEMTGIRRESYDNFINEYPFSILTDLERSTFHLSTEQNWHDNIEIQLCTRGNGSVLLDGERHEIHVGDIVAIDSNTVHYTYTDSILWYTCLIVSTGWCRQMGISYDTLHFTPIIKNPAIAKLMQKLAQTSTDKTDALRIAKSNELLLCIMIELVENYSEQRNETTQKNRKYEVIKDAVIYIQENFTKKLTLSEISKTVYLDKYTLCKEFKRYTGHTIVEYLHIYRCGKAKKYLTEGKSVAESAVLCGFDNISFFTKIFKRYTGENPSYFKK